VSRKTIAFIMPAAGRGKRERAPPVIDGLTGERVAFAAAEERLRDAGPDAKTEEWVRERAPRDGAEPAPALEVAPLPGFAFGASVTVNLAAERDLMETMTLSFIVPFALGWFWFAHAMARRQRLWGV
jgi:hypothetical protein